MMDLTEYNHEAHKRWRAKNKDKVKAQNDRHREKHPEQGRARQAIYSGQKKGKIKKPKRCSRCHKKTKSLELHHKYGYNSNQERGVWLCRKCHMKIEKRHKISKAMKEEVLYGMAVWYAKKLCEQIGGNFDKWINYTKANTYNR